MNSWLFVYGTLMSQVRHPMGARLRREARLLGEATIEGRLYSLGRYPGLVESADGHYAVHGEVYDLKNPLVSLKWLDDYEGIVPGTPDRSPYERVERPVHIRAGIASGESEARTAWVYLYRKSVRTRPEILGGFWVPPQL